MSDELERIPTIQAWERQPGESTVAYSHFASYRDLGPLRSLSKAAAMLDMSKDTLAEHSARWDWVERATAYDDWYERRLRNARENARLEADQRQSELALALLQPVALRLNGGVQRREDGTEIVVQPLDPNTLDGTQLTAMAKAYAEMERRSLGQPMDVLRGIVGGTVSKEEYVKLAKGMFEIALRFIDPDRQPRYQTQVEHFYASGELPAGAA